MQAVRTYSPRLILAERLTLAVLLSGVASLALSDFVSPFYWGIVVLVAAVRLWRGPGFSLTEMQSSLIGWAGLLWVVLEFFLGRAWVVAFTDFLLILSFAIVIEEATPRNHLHRMLIGFFLILGAAVLTDSVLYIIPLALFLWFIWRASQTLYGMQHAGHDLPLTPWRSDVRTMVVMAAITGLLFVLLPRFDFQSYLKPVQPRTQTSGFSEKVQLGDFARTLDATVAFRVEPVDMDPETFRKMMMGRYWRGTTLSSYTGLGWERKKGSSVTRWQQGDDAKVSGGTEASKLKFALYREASDHPYIFVPDGLHTMTRLPAVISMDDQGSIYFESPPARRLRIVMQAGKRDVGLEGLRAPVAQERERQSVPESVALWAANIAGSSAEKREILSRLMMELKAWEYDLNAPIDGIDPVGSFLKLKRGHCELYATLLALAARSQGIAARVVNGYFGGEWNETGGFYLVRQQHAHSWVEAWVDGQWQRFDPTPASRWQLSGVRFQAVDEVWESIKLKWYRYVLEFQDSDRTQAFSALIKLLKTYLLWIVLATMGGALLLLLKRRGAALLHAFSVSGIYGVLDRWLMQRGIERQLHQPLSHLPLPKGVKKRQWRQFIDHWECQAYGGVKRWSRRDLKRHLRAL